jgi:aspartyl-tRNA synthetase
MVSYIRTHLNGELTKADIGKKVTLAGWVHRRRDHGGLIFIDLRDRFGLTQVVFNPELNSRAHEIASELRGEWVISIKGKVIPRAQGMINTKLKTGEIEIEAHEIEILSRAKTPPFSISDEKIMVNEELRLKYRYLDIRRGEIASRLIARHKLMLATRNYMDKQRFIEVTTPILGKSTPEGARDYLVPSRVYPGQFYALPQSPQLFKQLLMIGGMDRYFQIATCFRDEDLRADRQPEFSQIDIEMSFGTFEELAVIVEGLCGALFKDAVGLDVYPPFRRMTYQEAVEKYGTDKPDLRFGMPFHRITDLLKESNFSQIKQQIDQGAIVKGFCVKGGAELSRKSIDDFTTFVAKFGLGGLAWIKMTSEGPTSSITKFFDTSSLNHLVEKMEAAEGDLILFGAAPEKNLNQALDHLRRHIANTLGLIKPNLFEFTWVTDFPLFQWDDETHGYACEHHPFTSPHLEDLHLLEVDPLKCRSSSYDLVLNGYEIASGSQRIHDSDLQEKIFKILKLSAEEIKKRFGFFIEALSYGTPPHLGIALGFDRLTMIVTQTDGIRDVIAFPKTQRASDLMLEAPSSVMRGQLAELKIHVEPTNEG